MDSQESGPAARFAVAVLHVAERIVRWSGHQLMRPRARTFVVGVVLILIAALFVGHSFWTAPLVIIGVVMIIVAWVGSRLEGRFAIEWSELGTGFEMHARFKSANARPQLAGPGAPAPEAPHVAKRSVDDDDDVIEGEAHTMEIPAEELRALVAALEQVAPLVHRSDDTSNVTSTVASSNGFTAAAQPSADEH